MLERIKPYYEDAKSQLAETPHFGGLDLTLGTTVKLTRDDYAVRHCDLLLEVKKAVSGLGLGSKNGFPRSDNRDDYAALRDWTGLEVCQAWVVLLNAGHLFATFATERALLFHLDRELQDREVFVNIVVEWEQDKGNALRAVVERALNQARLHSFFYLLALWRLRDGGVSKLKGPERDLARLLVKAFLDPPSEAVKRWRDVFRRTRQLCYMAMHKSVTQAKYVVSSDNLAADELRALFPTDSLPEADWTARSKWDVIEALDRHDSGHLFCSPEAAAVVLRHVQDFKPWWSARRTSPEAFATTVDALFVSPPDWPQLNNESYQLFSDLRVPSRLDWLTEARLWLRDVNQEDPWAKANFLISPSPAGDLSTVDVYAGEGGISTKTLRHVVLQLSRAYHGAHSDRDNQSLWMSGARFMAAAFTARLRPRYAVRLQPTRGYPGHVGYASIGDTYESVRGMVKMFLAASNDPSRDIELRHLLTVLDRMNRWRDPAMIMLARTLIVDTEENGREMTDIDGMCGIFDNNRLSWILMECKKKDSDNGEKQLRTNLAPCLTTTMGSVSHEMSGTCDVWWFECASPEHLTPKPA